MSFIVASYELNNTRSVLFQENIFNEFGFTSNQCEQRIVPKEFKIAQHF